MPYNCAALSINLTLKALLDIDKADDKTLKWQMKSLRFREIKGLFQVV
jgi:hypothetical protein